MNSQANCAELVGAFFDLDGTVLPAPSLEWRFIGYLLARDEISTAHVGGWLAECARRFWHDPRGATEGNKRYLAGIREELVNDWEKSLATETLAGELLPFFEEALQRIAWHQAQCHRVFFVSGTLAPLARVVARSVGARDAECIEVCATELEAGSGCGQIWSGRILGEHMSGEAKSAAVKTFAARYGLDPSRSYAYGNGVRDAQMLEAVGNAVAVNPTRRLERVARKRGWRTCIWNKTIGEISDVGARQFAAKAAR